MTPGRLNELRCPSCQRSTWTIDSDYRGMDGVLLPYDSRTIGCPACGYVWARWTLLQQAPPEFLLQPHDLYPMTQSEFDHWLGVLRTHFPDHPKACRRDFVPRLPADAVRTLEADARSDPRFAALQVVADRIKAQFHLPTD